VLHRCGAGTGAVLCQLPDREHRTTPVPEVPRHRCGTYAPVRNHRGGKTVARRHTTSVGVACHPATDGSHILTYLSDLSMTLLYAFRCIKPWSKDPETRSVCLS